MKILHICSEYRDSKVHSELFQRLDEKGIKQTIFCFFREKRFVGINQFKSINTEFIYADILTLFDKYLFYYRVNKLFRYLKAKIDVQQYDLSHAATLFSNGYLSYLLYKKYNIPYIIAIRSTDFLYFRKAPHIRVLAKRILINASKIIFISESLRNRLEKEKSVQSYLDTIRSKCVVQPNGINKYWLENINRDTYAKTHTSVYVGTFLKRKNVDKLIMASENLRKLPEYNDLHLFIAGGGKDDGSIKDLIDKHRDFIDYKGVVREKAELLKLYRHCSIFAMPSIFETFGLVFIEALSQNTALIYSKGYGIDGMFQSRVGEGVDASDVKSIEEAIITIFNNRDNYSNKYVDFSVYDWERISNNYLKMYEYIKD